ncbi:hypothetical protein ACFL0L_02275 [Patescibacteria group bacterium]
MIIKSLPVKVWIRGIDHQSEGSRPTVVRFAVSQDFHFPLPAVHCVDITVREDQFTTAPQWFTCCKTWEQALAYLERTHEGWPPKTLWLDIYGAEVEEIAAAGEKRKLNPTFWYCLRVNKFAVLTWPRDKSFKT